MPGARPDQVYGGKSQFDCVDRLGQRQGRPAQFGQKKDVLQRSAGRSPAPQRDNWRHPSPAAEIRDKIQPAGRINADHDHVPVAEGAARGRNPAWRQGGELDRGVLQSPGFSGEKVVIIDNENFQMTVSTTHALTRQLAPNFGPRQPRIAVPSKSLPVTRVNRWVLIISCA